MKRNLSTVWLGIAALACAVPAMGSVVVDGYTWDYAYTGDVLPTAASPAWTSFESGSASASGGKLTIDTNTTDGRYFQIDEGGAWNPESGSVTWVQTGVQVNSQSSEGVYPNDSRFATGIYIGGAGKSVSLNFGTYNDGSGLKTGVFDRLHQLITEVNVFQYHTYRVSLDPSNSQYTLYVDSFATPVKVGTTDSDAYGMYFGDGSGNTRGSADWDYIAWNNATAPVAVPEPAALGLLGFSALALRRRRA